jgi:hypothetical protein
MMINRCDFPFWRLLPWLGQVFTTELDGPIDGSGGCLPGDQVVHGIDPGTSKVLLDHQIPDEVQNRIRGILESYKDTRVIEMHIWSIGPGIYSSEIAIVTKHPEPPGHYKSMIPPESGVVHTTMEVHTCTD